MKVTTVIHTENEAFQKYCTNEVARILRKLADKVLHERDFSPGHSQALLDINGNEAGYLLVEGEDETRRVTYRVTLIICEAPKDRLRLWHTEDVDVQAPPHADMVWVSDTALAQFAAQFRSIPHVHVGVLTILTVDRKREVDR